MLLGTAILALIASLFFRMLIAKDARQITILQAIGFSASQIRLQYLFRALIVLGVSICVGIVASVEAGEGIISKVLSAMGAPAIQLIIVPWEVFLASPTVLIAVVLLALLFAVKIERSQIVSQMIE